MLSAVGGVKYFILNDAYYQKTENIALINRWEVRSSLLVEDLFTRFYIAVKMLE